MSMAVTPIEPGKYRVQSVARAAFIVFEIAQSPDGLTPREVSERVQIHLQTTYHLLHTLTSTGLLARRNDRYILGLRCAAIGEAFKRQLAPPEYLGPAVREIAARTGEAAQAVGWDDAEIVAVSFARGRFPVQAAEVPYGSTDYGHARATGKLLLAYATPELREAYLSRNPLRKRTDNTITDRRRFDQELEEIRARGYAVDNEEFSEGLCCLAVPLGSGLTHFAFGVSAPADRLRANFEDYLEGMQEIARSVLVEDPAD
jgi:DNA-binding IclR family transcriptional regulator